MPESSSFYCIRAFITTWSQKGDTGVKAEGKGRVRGVQCVLTDVSKKVKTKFDELTFVVKYWIRNLLMVPQHTSVRDQSNLMSDVIVFLSNFERSTLPLPSVSLWASLSQGGNVSERSERGQGSSEQHVLTF